MKAIDQDLPEMEKCITEERLLQYMQGSLEARQQHQIEMHLLHCELCSDALEGLHLLKNKDKTTEIVTALKHQVNEHLRQRKVLQPVFMKWWQIAAVFTILFLGAGSYFFIRNYTESLPDNTVVIETQPKKSDPEKVTTDEKTEAIEKKSDPVILKYTTEKAVQEQTGRENSIRETADMPDHKAAAAEVTTTDEFLFKAKEELKAPATKEQHELDPSTDSRMKDADNLKSVAAVKKQEKVKSFNEGLQYYNENNFGMALNSFNRAGPDPMVNFYAGKCQYNLNNYKEAIFEIDKAITDSSNQFYEEALWLKANALVGLKQKEKAKPILEKVIQLDGNFKNQANNLLKNL